MYCRAIGIYLCMYERMHHCLYIYIIYIYVHTPIYVYACIHVYECINNYLHVCKKVYTHVCIYVSSTGPSTSPTSSGYENDNSVLVDVYFAIMVGLHRRVRSVATRPPAGESYRRAGF